MFAEYIDLQPKHIEAKGFSMLVELCIFNHEAISIQKIIYGFHIVALSSLVTSGEGFRAFQF